jgi:hypothetical protein
MPVSRGGRKRSNLLLAVCLVVAALPLVGCDTTESIPLHQARPGPIGDPSWVTVQVIYVEILATPSDVDQIDEFRFFIVAGEEDPTYSAALVFPADHNLAVRAGDVIDISRYGLSVDAKTLDGELYVYFVGVDSDLQDAMVNQGINVVTGLIAEGLALVVAQGNPVVSMVTAFVLSQISQYVQEDDIVGDGLFVLRASEG